MIAHTVTLKDGTRVPALGQGTWYLGDHADTRAREIEALRLGIDRGMTLIDTAEMYGSGRSESLVGEAIRGLDRDSLFLVSKVLPQNAGDRGLARSCQATLKRLGTDHLDLYLLHWRGSIPFEETIDGMERLVAQGKIRRWGVSNLDIDDMQELLEEARGTHCVVDQVLYHAASRGIEYSLKPWLTRQGIALMAYCPLAQAGQLQRGLMTDPVLSQIAQAHGCTVAQVLLAWCIRDGHTIAIPRSSRPEHTLMNADADSVALTPEDLRAIDRRFAPPTRKEYLDIQ